MSDGSVSETTSTGLRPTAVETALLALTLAAVISLARLFVDASFLLPLAVGAVAAHLTAAVSRRRGLNVAVAAAASTAVAGFVTTLVLYPGTTFAGLPTTTTWTAAGDDLSVAWQLFGEVVAPAPVERGFLLATTAAIWLIAFTADWAAFRLRLTFESVIPAGILFVFGSLLGAERHRLATTGLVLAATLAFLLLHRAAGQEASAGWAPTDARRGRRALVRTGAGVGALAVLAGVLVGPALPGATEPALVAWRDSEGGPGSRITISPLVDIQARLVQQSALEAFQVQSDVRAYWRLTSLDSFDGRIWRSDGNFGSADGRLPSDLPDDLPVEAARQTFTISGLSAIWVPAAFEARAVDTGEADVRWDEDSSTLIVDTDFETSDGLTYTVDSAIPRLTPERLAAVRSEVPDEIAQRYLPLPETFPQSVRLLADQVVAEAAAVNPYDQAIALQDFLRSDQFSYDLDVPAGHGEDQLERFLLAAPEEGGRRGYCEQFAGSYAAMARAVGLPSRVAVGFTPGVEDPNQLGSYTVRGEQAHAWPEVYLTGVGWVAFEPTPGRGAPGAEAYTGVAESQSVDGQNVSPVADAPVPTTTPSAPTTAVPPASTPQGDPLLEGAVDPVTIDGPTNPWPGRVVRSVLVILAVLALYVVVVLSARMVSRRRRQAAATSPDRRVELAWTRAAELLRLAGVRPGVWETPSELADRATARLELDPDVLGRLAGAAAVVAYSPAGIDEEGAERAEEALGALRERVLAGTSRRARVQAALDPRPLLPAHSRRRAVVTDPAPQPA